MSLFTKQEARRSAGQASGATSSDLLVESVLNVRADAKFRVLAEAARTTPVRTFDIFLSHAFADQAIVLGIYTLLSQSGFTVYVDWIHDRQLDRSVVSPATADVLRKRMRQCKSLFFVTTTNATNSKWMPWECGYFDGFDSKTMGEAVQHGHVAILPVVDEGQGTFKGQEYLGLYPLAEKGNYPRRNVDIHNQADRTRYKHFDAWVANGHP